MRKGRFFIAILGVLIGLELCLSGCGGGKVGNVDLPGGMTKIQVGEIEQNLAYTPFYVAIEEGFFEKEGIAIQLWDAGSEKEIQNAVLSGECDVGLMGSDNSILSYAENKEDWLVNFGLLTTRAEPVLVAREDMGKLTSKMFSGACVLGEEAGMSELVFRYILEKNGISDAELTFQSLQNNGMVVESFQNGEGDLTLMLQPCARNLEKAKEGYCLLFLGKESGDVPYSSFCTGREYLENHKQILLAFTKALQHGMDFVSKHSEEEIAEKISGMFPKTDKKDLEKIIGTYKEMGMWKNNTAMEKSEYALLQNILMDYGKISQPVLYDEVCADEFYQAVLGGKNE